MTEPIRVLVVDDHAMFAESLVRLLIDDPMITVIGTASTAAEGLARARAENPDIVLMDYSLPDMNGSNATRDLLHTDPQVKVITLTGSDFKGAYQAAISAGSSAWVRKTRAIQDLKEAVHNVHMGNAVHDDELAGLPTIDQLLVYYQPVVDISSERITGFEALVRWQHPTRGILAPSAFLAEAEETGLIIQIGECVRSVAIQQLAVWQHRFPLGQHLSMSVNASASELSQPDFAESIGRAVVATSLDPSDVVLEVTETVLIENEAAVSRLHALKSVGVLLGLDDFGTGFSSLSYLQRYPFDIVKIDTSFTAEILHSARTLLLVETMQQLTRSLGLRGVVEGIEQPEQALALMRAGWQFGQGYLYSRAVDAERCDRLLAAQLP
jgi:EAL domain-containing protein (putative c-di-GMP-specific phosphodiesterase class I)